MLLSSCRRPFSGGMPAADAGLAGGGSRRHPQQAFRSCLGILRLANSYSEDRLEAAAGKAVAIGAHSYRSVESILTHRLDERPGEQIELAPPIEHANIRGAHYFKSKEN